MVGLVLSPAQRSLAEKSLAVRRARDEKENIQKAIEEASRRRIDEIRKARCDTMQHHQHALTTASAKERDHRLIIRHVGEQLASVAKRELLHEPRKCGKKAIGPHQDAANRSSTTWLSQNANDKSTRSEGTNGDNEYDEDRFGSVRRPPRVRPPNLWVSIFEKEQADVKHEQEEAKRKRLADTEQYRVELAQQEAHKQTQKQHEREVADKFAQMQAKQVAAWKEQAVAKQRDAHEAMVAEAKRCQQELQQTLEQQVAAQRKKAHSELRVLERYKTMMEEEKRQKELKKQQHKQEMALVKQANAMQLELKRKVLQREQEEEVLLQKEYTKKLSLQEQQRQEELAAILAKQSQKVKLALLNVKSAEEKAREDEERAAIIQAQVRKKEEEELKRRAARTQEVAHTQVLALVQQKAERRQQHLAEQQAEDAYAKESKRDFQQWQQKEIGKKLAVRERNRDYQTLLKQQIALDETRKASEDKYGMTCEEMSLNAALLKKAGVAQVPQDAARTRQY